MNLSSNTTSSFHGRSRSKRSRSTSSWTSSLQNPNATTNKNKESSVHTRERSSSMNEDVPRRCTHCASEKTPQWRTGPLGPKTLCNACGVRYKSGRLVPEYRPAASPTFVLTQHSNSHRKVMELRRQKEMIHQQQQMPPSTEEGMYGHHFRASWRHIKREENCLYRGANRGLLFYYYHANFTIWNVFFFFFKYLFSFCFYFLEKIEFRIIFITVLPGVIFGNLSKRFFIEFRNWQLGLRWWEVGWAFHVTGIGLKIFYILRHLGLNSYHMAT